MRLHAAPIQALVLVLLVVLSPLPAAGGHASPAAPRILPLPPALVPVTTATPRPAATAVDPFALIQSEPAPMGITDFGITDSSGVGQPYSYGTPIIEGTADIHSLLESGHGLHVMTFQLNTVAVLGNHGTNYSYWVQNVAALDTSTNTIVWENNIWNLSEPITTSASDPLSSSELLGNGTVNYVLGIGYWYATQGSVSLPGQNVVLSYPLNVSARSVVSEVNGLPHVAFQYEDGFGWVTFDNVTFAHGSGWTNYGFVVDGYTYTPLGVFYDAEWDYSGMQQGEHNVACDLNMTLSYWNGHNMEAPPSAWNFGSNTAESVDNVIASVAHVSADGSLYSHLTNGSGSLGRLYSPATVSQLTVLTPTTPAGTLELGGHATDYQGGSADLIVAPGTYPVALYEGTQLVDNGTITLTAGTHTTLTLPYPQQTVTFAETGLMSGTNWSVSVGTKAYDSTTPWINVSVKNGSYAYALGAVPGFLNHIHQGNVQVAGHPVEIVVPFYVFNYTVLFAAFGLPTGTPWWITFHGTTVEATSTSVTLVSPNGTFPYTVTTVNAFLGNLSSGSVTVFAAPTEVDISFSVHLGSLAGSVVPKNATVLVDGQPVVLLEGLFNLSETPGVHTVTASAPGYVTVLENDTVTAGNQTLVTLTLNLTSTGPSGGSSGSDNAGSFAGLGMVGLLAVLLVIAVLAIAGMALLVRRRRR